MRGTFEEWIAASTPGEWSYQHAVDGSTVRVSLGMVTRTYFEGAYTDRHIMYEVQCDGTIAPNTPLHYEWADQIVAAGHVRWDSVGEVITR